MNAILPSGSLRRYSGDYAAHSHGFAQILVGRAGRLELEVEGRGAVVDAASGLVVPAGARHAFLAGRGGAQVWVVDAPDAPGLARWRRFAAPWAWQQAVGVGTAGGAGLLLDALASAPVVQARRALDVERLAQSVDAALHEAWPTVRMAARFGLSAPRFHARFVALTGVTPQDWLRARRLDRAAALLRTGMGLDAAALQVGYATASALAFALRRDRGLGARALRRAGA